ncbi:MAG: hypothetical protein JO213_11030 [Alphaproteobacteria bacterium]|nr:hypothetical protein [Alphaproteobacteria bacterium]MBV9150856.1 hypothetical protein [Alphaproteobacteria bacterium]MBV9585408.1 hypothetical protein [Alphaproteobacteria bacterium]MBV9965999.1 hypothetical protein [Alphaproteobacteria bacterium]
MGLSAGPAERRAGNYANAKRDIRSRKPLMLIIAAAIASVVVGGAVMAAVLNYKPVQQHIEMEITPPAQ